MHRGLRELKLKQDGTTFLRPPLSSDQLHVANNDVPAFLLLLLWYLSHPYGAYDA